jgi:hypothetical protein
MKGITDLFILSLFLMIYRMSSLNGLNYNVKLINFKPILISNVLISIMKYSFFYSIFVCRFFSSKESIGCPIHRFNRLTPPLLHLNNHLLLLQRHHLCHFLGPPPAGTPKIALDRDYFGFSFSG